MVNMCLHSITLAMRLHLKSSLGMKILMDCVQKWRQLSLLPCSLRYLTTLALPTPHKLTLPTPHSLTQCYTYTQPSSRESCWKCGIDLNVSGRMEGVRFFCPCDKHIILPPSKTQTYFEIMNWLVLSLHIVIHIQYIACDLCISTLLLFSPTTYRIDTDQLKQTFKQLQRQLHPDKFSNKSQVSLLLKLTCRCENGFIKLCFLTGSKFQLCYHITYIYMHGIALPLTVVLRKPC